MTGKSITFNTPILWSNTSTFVAANNNPIVIFHIEGLIQFVANKLTTEKIWNDGTWHDTTITRNGIKK